MTKASLWWHRIRHWEYWSVWIVYFPCIFMYVWYVIRSRRMFYFTAANPSIKHGGAFEVPKSEIYDQIPTAYIPKTLVINPDVKLDAIRHWLDQNKLAYPVICKPDTGLRGIGLKVINNDKQLSLLLNAMNEIYLVQELVPYGNEIGIFFVKNGLTTEITSIVGKEFMQVTGDGKSTLRQLISATKRLAMQLNAIKQSGNHNLNTILRKGEIYAFEKIGNHSRGTKFIDANHLNSAALVELVDMATAQFEELNYGRIDLKYKDATSLAEHREFKVIEINGVFSEPAHIYDPNHTIWYAWREVTRHFKLMYKTSQRMLSLGYLAVPRKEGLRLSLMQFKALKR